MKGWNSGGDVIITVRISIRSTGQPMLAQVDVSDTKYYNIVDTVSTCEHKKVKMFASSRACGQQLQHAARIFPSDILASNHRNYHQTSSEMNEQLQTSLSVMRKEFYTDIICWREVKTHNYAWKHDAAPNTVASSRISRLNVTGQKRVWGRFLFHLPLLFMQLYMNITLCYCAIWNKLSCFYNAKH